MGRFIRDPSQEEEEMQPEMKKEKDAGLKTIGLLPVQETVPETEKRMCTATDATDNAE